MWTTSIMSKKTGKIDISKLNVPPEKHELKVARYFAELGYDIEFIPPSNIPDVHRPDILMQGKEWEIKSPQGKAKRTIEQNYRKAAKQSKFIIFDLRRCPIPESQSLGQLQREFTDRHTKRLLVILKNGSLQEYSQK